MSGRKPDYKIHALNKITEAKGEIGAAWANPDGTITLVFNAFVAVPVSGDVVITMFKNVPKEERQPHKQPLQVVSERYGGSEQDEIPF